VELNVAFTAERGRDRTAWEAPLLDFNLGVGERIQLKAELAWLVVDEQARSAVAGLGNTNLGIKCRFLDEDRDGVAVSVYPQYEFNTAGSSADRGLVDEGTELFLPFQIQRSLGFVDLDLELGYARVEEGSDRWQCGLACGRELGERFELLAELYGTADRELDRGQLDFGVGCRWAPGEQFRFLFSAGRTLAGPAEDELEFFSYLGVQLLF
jgi:hypothetical protein